MLEFSAFGNISVHQFNLYREEDREKIPCYSAGDECYDNGIIFESAYINKDYFIGIIPYNIGITLIFQQPHIIDSNYFLTKIKNQILKNFDKLVFVDKNNQLNACGFAFLSKSKVENSYIFRGEKYEESGKKILENLYIRVESESVKNHDILFYLLSWQYQEDTEGLLKEADKFKNRLTLFEDITFAVNKITRKN